MAGGNGAGAMIKLIPCWFALVSLSGLPVTAVGDKASKNRTTVLALSENETRYEYVGTKKCRSCHSRSYESWLSNGVPHSGQRGSVRPLRLYPHCTQTPGRRDRMIRLSNVPNVIARGTRATTAIIPRRTFHIQDTDPSSLAGSHFPCCVGDQSSRYSLVVLLRPFGP